MRFTKIILEYFITAVPYGELHEGYGDLNIYFFPIHRVDDGNVHSAHGLEIFLFEEIFA